MLPKKPLIIGAGPAGLCVGWNLSLDGVPVTILEKNKETGGLSLTFKDDGYLFDLGPHNIHTIYPDIVEFLKKTLKNDFCQHNPITKIIFRDQFVTYPLKGINVFKALPITTIIPAGFSFLWARIQMFARDPKNDDSFESWIKNRFGTILYNYYFGPYAQKAWKINASEISNYVAEKRVPVISIRDYIRGLFKKPPRLSHSEFGPEVNHYYPRKGVGQITDYLTKGIVDNSGKIEKNVEVLSINGSKERVESVTYKQDGEVKTVDIDFLFSTIPINKFIEILNLDVPEEVKEAASGLDYCSESLLYIKTSRSQIFDTALLYFSDPKIKFNRVYEVGSFSKDCVPPGKSALCVEFTCNIGDEVWTAEPDELFNYAMGILKRFGNVDKKDVEGYFVRKITHAYPRFRTGFEDRLKLILDYLSSIDNVITFGRQGLFCYANVDDALHMGFRATEMLSTIRRKGIDYSELFPKYVNY